MKNSQKLAILIFIILVSLFIALMNWPFVMTQIIKPLSLVTWLLLRIFVLSIDQKYYWWALIFVVTILIFRILPREISTFEQPKSNYLNETLITITHWRSLYMPNDSNVFGKFREREFIRMMLSLYASKLHTEPDYKLYEALQNGSIPVPEQIRTILFPVEQKKEKRTIRTITRSFFNAPRLWLYRSTGREAADKNQMIEELLAFFETSLEMNDEDR
jgi:hypothetical protein